MGPRWRAFLHWLNWSPQARVGLIVLLLAALVFLVLEIKVAI